MDRLVDKIDVVTRRALQATFAAGLFALVGGLLAGSPVVASVWALLAVLSLVLRFSTLL
jgi:hypothetical protein